MRVHERGENELVRAGIGDVVARAPVVQIDVCRCGHAHAAGSPHAVTSPAAAPPAEPEWALASAWTWLTRPADADALVDGDTQADAEAQADGDAQADAEALPDASAEVEPEDVPWWDARARPEHRRAMLGVVLLGELQAGVLLRAVWEVVQSSPSGPLA